MQGPGIDLDVSLLMQLPGGGWLELEDPGNGYSLGKDTFSSRSITHKKVEIDSPWLEGSFVNRAYRNNVIETVAVYVSGSSAETFLQRMRALEDLFSRPQYNMQIRIESRTELWRCQSADMTIETSQELMVAKSALVRAQVPRMPQVVTP